MCNDSKKNKKVLDKLVTMSYNDYCKLHKQQRANGFQPEN